MTSNRICTLLWFQERDIDMWLAEELRVNPAFSLWFMEQVAPGLDVDHPAIETRVSAPTNGSETDVLATFALRQGGRHRVWIENKINAALMPCQLERYFERADSEVRGRASTSYSVVLFAPQAYTVDAPAGVVRLSFENVAKMLSEAAPDLRTAYRAELLLRAAEYASPTRQSSKIIDSEPHIVEWWDGVYEMLDRTFPNYFIMPKSRYMREMFFALRTADLASYLRVDFKPRRGEVDLAFKNLPYDTLKRIVDQVGGSPGLLIKNARSSAIRIGKLPQINFDTPPDAPEVYANFSAARNLIEFWRFNRTEFDRAAAG
ncbi:MAG: hypothetical protein ACK4MV_10130 [Beijerinckiaceae bacterium]